MTSSGPQSSLDKETAPAPPRGLMAFAIAAAATLVIVGAVAFYYASIQSGDAHGDMTVVTIGNNRCSPNEMTVPAGRHTFKIVNQSDRIVEWEILDGVMVLEERENIAPGFSQTLTTKLQPGTFAMTCGLLSNPRGILNVAPSAESKAEAAHPSLVAFIGPLAEYRVYLMTQVSDLRSAVAALDAAIRSGDLAQARALYEKARIPYDRIRPAAERFADLDHTIDPTADYLEKREADPAFTGFHRIEYALFAKNSLDGLTPISTRLVSDVDTLEQRIGTITFSPAELGASAARLAHALADAKIAVGLEHYAHTDLADFAANLDGIAKITSLFKPIAARSAPDAMSEVEMRVKDLNETLGKFRSQTGYRPYTSVDESGRRALSQQMGSLADAIDKLNAALGLDERG